MGLLRFAARTMLASYFVVNGVRAVTKPQELAADAEPVTDAIVPMIKRFAPVEVAARFPTDAATLVRITGAVQTFGGLALATGIGRRFGALLLAGSLVPVTLARHPFWTRSDPEQRATDQAQFVKNIALLGGVLIASADTEGKPGLAWRAEEGRKRLAQEAGRATDAAEATLKRGEAKLKRGGAAVRREAKRAAHDARQAARTAQREARLAVKDAQIALQD